MSTGTASAAKKQRKDDVGDDEAQSPVAEKDSKDEPKPKPTRGSRYVFFPCFLLSAMARRKSSFNRLHTDPVLTPNFFFFNL
jgi:hypothetical protein